MGVKIVEREYRDIFRPLDTGIDWLIGNTGTWQTLKLRCEFDVAIAFTTNNPLFMEEPNVLTLNDGKTWQDYGFDVGDIIVVQWAVTNNDTGSTSYYQTLPFDILEIRDNIAIGNISTFGGGARISNIYPVQLADEKIHSVFISADKRPQGIRFKYNHLTNQNADSLSFASFIDGSETEFLAEDTDLMPINAVQTMQSVGLESGMSVSNCALQYIGNNGATYVYDIYITFMISSFFEDVNNFENNISPPQTFDAECLTDVFLVTGYPKYNNPNIKIESVPSITKKIGNTGWFDENFNGLANDFTLTSIEYRNLNGDLVSQLDYKNNITVRAVIDGVTNLSGITKCGFGFAWIPLDENIYKGQPNQYYRNLKMNTGGAINSFGDSFNVSNVIDTTLRQGYSIDDAKMNVKNLRFQATGATQITFTAEFEPSSEFATYFDTLDVTERNYLLWVSVADQSEEVNKSNRVSLRLDYNEMDTFITPVGEYEGMQIDFLDHPRDENDGPAPCGSSNFIEDDLLAKIQFLVDTDVSPTIPIPTALEYGILIQKISDGTQYKLDSYTIDLTQYPSVSQYNFNQTRGFKLETGNNKNFVKANYYPAIDTGTKLGVLGLYGFKIRWEDWIKRPNIPTTIYNDFYDNSLPSDGLSNDWYRYLLNAGYEMYFYVNMSATLDGTAVVYGNKKHLVFSDYDSNSDITTTFTYKRASDNTVLTGGTDPISGLPLGVILSNEDVLLEIEYTRGVGTWASLSEVYGVSSIEVDKGAGQFEYRQLSSVWGSELDNPLIPISGATKLDLVLVSPTILRASCLINPNNLIKATRYKITGREGCK